MDMSLILLLMLHVFRPLIEDRAFLSWLVKILSESDTAVTVLDLALALDRGLLRVGWDSLQPILMQWRLPSGWLLLKHWQMTVTRRSGGPDKQEVLVLIMVRTWLSVETTSYTSRDLLQIL